MFCWIGRLAFSRIPVLRHGAGLCVGIWAFLLHFLLEYYKYYVCTRKTIEWKFPNGKNISINVNVWVPESKQNRKISMNTPHFGNRALRKVSIWFSHIFFFPVQFHFSFRLIKVELDFTPNESVIISHFSSPLGSLDTAPSPPHVLFLSTFTELIRCAKKMGWRNQRNREPK